MAATIIVSCFARRTRYDRRVSLANDYRRQAQWRDWTTAFSLLPELSGKRMLDIGCAIGDQTAELARRGASVVGVDINPDLLKVARSRGIANAELVAELPSPSSPPFDGIWSSFAPAYFVDLSVALQEWRSLLAPGGFIALVEVDDLFAHEPLAEESARILSAFADDTAAARRYDFRMGRWLRPCLEECGFTVTVDRTLADAELAFDGPAAPDVLEAWQSRFDRLRGLHAFAGTRYEAVRDDFLACLQHPAHRSAARVCMCIGTLANREP